MTPKKIVISLALVAMFYLGFPIVAGVFAIGDRNGPKIYPRSYHTLLYMVHHEWVRNEKPRQNPEFEPPWISAKAEAVAVSSG